VRQKVRFLENPAYCYAVGRVRALEVRLLDRERYDRLARAGGPAEFARALADTPYADAAAGKTPADFSAGLERSRAANREFLAGYAVDLWLTALYRVPADFHNLKVLARIGDGGPPGRTRAAGAVPDRVRDRFVALLAERPGPAELDYALDRLEHTGLMEELAPSDYLSGWCRLRADTSNFLAALRLRDAARLEQALLPGGHVPLRTWRELAEAEPAAYQRRFRGTAFEPACAAVEQFLLTGRGDRLDRLVREAELRFLAQARFAVLGHEPLACFHLFTENEIGNLGRLHAAKTAGRSPEECADLVAV